MGRPTTYKIVQVHQECSCGHNIVDQWEMQIKFKDLAAAGIRYKKDPSTGEYFFMQHIKYQCEGHEEQY
jgi:hypothetical protein